VSGIAPTATDERVPPLGEQSSEQVEECARSTAAYQVERRLAELGDAVAVHEKARAEMLISDSRQAVKAEAPVERLRSLTAEPQALHHGLGTATSASGPGGVGSGGVGSTGAGSGPGAPGGTGNDDVIDAEFTSG
jgi:molecular chaperone DnaK